ncbi:MAG: hypothetical protein OXG97_07950 [Candidatus Poribacteria bacterium]|nr:hypothetical protein [Candidatus Poribacteria bacterium]
MKKNLRGKIREFVQSEEGKVGVKSPLTLGAAVGSVLLAQAIVATPVEAGECTVVFTFHHQNRPEVSAYQNWHL